MNLNLNVEENPKMLIKERQSESGHWYDREGNPAYTVKSKTGNLRPTTLRDARTLNLCPSVTTILGVAAKPGLDTWKQQQVLLSALTLPREPNEPEQAWLERVMMDSKQTGRIAADRGTNIHATIQAFFEGQLIPEAMPICRPVEQAIKDHFGEQLWLPELSFAHPMGFGGKSDLTAKAKHGFEGISIDLKTKETTDLSKVDVFPEHGMQLAAYRQGFNMPKARCANVFVGYKMVEGNIVFTGVKVVEHSAEDLDRYWLMFTKLLEFWQLKNNHK